MAEKTDEKKADEKKAAAAAEAEARAGVEKAALVVSKKSQKLTITDDKSYTAAAALLVRAKAGQKKVDEFFGPTVRATNTAHKTALAAFNFLMAPLKAGERHLKDEIRDYGQQLKLRQARKQREADEAARKIAEAERQADVKALEDAGEKEAAVEVAAAPVAVTHVDVAPEVEVKGVHMVTRWHAEVTDIKALCKAVGSGKQPINLVQADMKVLNKLATALQANMNIPGVRALSTNSVSSRSV